MLPSSRGAFPLKSVGRESPTAISAAIGSGDKVLVVGGTGGVGQLTVGKLQGRGGFEV